jgi:hypothetical protein
MGRSLPICSPTRNQSNKRHCHSFQAVSLPLALPSPTFANSALAATANVAVDKSRVHTLPSPLAGQSTVAAPAQCRGQVKCMSGQRPSGSPAQVAVAVQSPMLAKGPLAATAQRTVVASVLASVALPIAGPYRLRPDNLGKSALSSAVLPRVVCAPSRQLLPCQHLVTPTSYCPHPLFPSVHRCSRQPVIRPVDRSGTRHRGKTWPPQRHPRTH